MPIHLITRVLVNLVENAHAHTPEGTAVEVAVPSGEGTVRPVVADDGLGIAAGQRGHALGRFGVSRTRPGSRLGLSLVAAVAKLHGARLVLEDNRPGLRVRIDFPVLGCERRGSSRAREW